MQEKHPSAGEDPAHSLLAALHAAIETMGADKAGLYSESSAQDGRVEPDPAPDLSTGKEPSLSTRRINLPSNIHELLDEGTTDTGMGSDTTILEIDGYPDLLARLNLDRTVENRLQAKQAADWLASLNVNTVPSEVVDHRGVPYVIVEWIEGTPLDEVLAAGDLSPTLAQALDTHWKQLTEALINARQNNRPWPHDVEGSNQCMVGTRPGESEVKVWITDFPYNIGTLDGPDYYEQEVLYTIEALLEVERVSGVRMPEARQALLRTIEYFRDSSTYGDGLAQGARHALEHNVPILPYADDDDLIESLRTR
jgi:hypothetical protein